VANINDSAGIFTGPTLEAFNAMQALVARDGDVAGAATVMRDACLKVCHTKQTASGGPNGTYTVKRS
jgi:hypothetical protein